MRIILFKLILIHIRAEQKFVLTYLKCSLLKVFLKGESGEVL